MKKVLGIFEAHELVAWSYVTTHTQYVRPSGWIDSCIERLQSEERHELARLHRIQQDRLTAVSTEKALKDCSDSVDASQSESVSVVHQKALFQALDHVAPRESGLFPEERLPVALNDHAKYFGLPPAWNASLPRLPASNAMSWGHKKHVVLFLNANSSRGFARSVRLAGWKNSSATYPSIGGTDV